jgi:5-methylcytosine-specific restriction endonuclease McrA
LAVALILTSNEKRRALLRAAFRRQRGRRCWCGGVMKLPVAGKPPEPCTATREHLVPKLYGGGLSKRNIKAACWKCNNDRGRRMVESLERTRDKKGA